MARDKNINDDQLIQEAQMRKEVSKIIDSMLKVEALPKPELKILQHIHLHKINKGKEVSYKTGLKYRFKDENGKVISDSKYKKMLESNILAQLKEKPELAYTMLETNSIIQQAVRSDMFDVFQHIISDPKARAIIHDNAQPLTQAIHSMDKKYYNEILKYDELMTARLPNGQGVLYASIRCYLPDHEFISALITRHPETLFHTPNIEPNVGMMAIRIKQLYQNKKYPKEHKHRIKTFLDENYDYIIDNILQACEQGNDSQIGKLAEELVDRREDKFYPRILKNTNWIRAPNSNPEENLVRFDRLNNYKIAKKIKDEKFDKAYYAEQFSLKTVNYKLAKTQQASANTDKTPIQKV